LDYLHERGIHRKLVDVIVLVQRIVLRAHNRSLNYPCCDALLTEGMTTIRHHPGRMDSAIELVVAEMAFKEIHSNDEVEFIN
jgi:hypothetical protein